MAPSSPAAALGASSASRRTRSMLSPDAKKLQAGLPLLQRPFSEAAGTVIFKRLQTVEAGVPGIRLTDGPQVLERLHPYIQWLASAIQRIGQPSPTTSSSSSGNSQRSMDHHASSSSSRGPSLLISPYVGAMLHCMIHVDDILQATDSEQAKPDNVAVIRDLLVEPQTGTLSLLAQVAEALLSVPTHTVGYMGLCNALLGLWNGGLRLAYPAPNTSGSSSSSSTSASSSTTADAASSSRSSSTAEGRLLHMAKGVPAMVRLLHRYLQQPVGRRSVAGREPQLLGKLTMQLHELLHAAARERRSPRGGSAAVQQQVGGATPAEPAGYEAPTQGLQPASSTPALCAVLASGANRAQVERFLWHALAAATAALQLAARAHIASSTRSVTTSSSSSSSTSSSSGSAIFTSRMWHRLPKGAAYSLQLPTEHALMVCNNALGALLVLATHDTPTQYHLDLHAASSWLQQQPGGTCRSQLHDLLTSFSELLELWRSSDDEDAASTAADDTTSSSEKASVGSSGVQDDPAAGYLCWPSKQLPAMHTTGTATSSGSGSSMAPAACSTGGNALGNAAARLQVLAVAAAALVHHIKLRSNVRGAGGPIEDAYGAIQAKEALNQLLVLLTQQLLCMAPQLRAAFLHSPAGSILLYVLEVISGGAGTGMSTASGLVTPRTHTAATQQQQQQQTDVTAEWDIHMLDGPDMVEKLLLPALLLHPAQSKPDAAAAPAAQSKCCGQEGMGGCTSRNAAMLDGTNCPLKGSTSSSGGTAATSIATITTSSNAATDTMTLAASCPNQRVALRMLGGALLPLALVPYGTLQLQPGCNPPPAAFFLVEQLLRASPSAANMTLAVQLLQGSVAVIKAPEQQQLGGQSAQGRANGRSKLQRLAYCSLASSVVQACLHHEQPQSGWAVLLLGLASELLQAAGQEAAGSSTTSSTSSGGPQGQWGLAACIAASAAAGAYKLHLGAAGVEAPLSPGGWEDVDNSSREAETVCGFSAPTATTTTISSSSSRGAGGTEPDTPASQEGGSSPCPNNCSVWCSAIKLYAAFCCREHGIAFATPSDAAGVAALERAAQQRGNSPQQYLQQKLLALAWRHPVPGVCGNVLCGRLEGPSAVGQVRGPKGTLCGGCRAAWYCCKECQLVAWEAHRLVCGGGK